MSKSRNCNFFVTRPQQADLRLAAAKENDPCVNAAMLPGVGYNRAMTSDRLQRVRQQLRLYEHPMVEFDARAKGEAVEVIIRPRFSDPPVHTYYFEMHPRDLDNPQFEWTFQHQLFDCLHDYLIEMFIRTPQHRKENQQMEREGKL